MNEWTCGCMHVVHVPPMQVQVQYIGDIRYAMAPATRMVRLPFDLAFLRKP